MSANYWRGIPVDRLPSRIFRAEYARLNAAIHDEKARISARQYENAENAALCARSTDASGEGITGDAGADREDVRTLAACLDEAQARGATDVREPGYTTDFYTVDAYRSHVRRAHPAMLDTLARLVWLSQSELCRYTGEPVMGYIHRLPEVDAQGTITGVPIFTPLALYGE